MLIKVKPISDFILVDDTLVAYPFVYIRQHMEIYKNYTLSFVLSLVNVIIYYLAMKSGTAGMAFTHSLIGCSQVENSQKIFSFFFTVNSNI